MKKEKISKRRKYINNLFSRVLISIILVLASVIFVKKSNKLDLPLRYQPTSKFKQFLIRLFLK